MAPKKEAGSSSSRRGRKIPDDQKARLNAALQALISHKSMAGNPLSVRDVADYYKVSKSTLHRYYVEATEKKKKQNSDKHSINFLLSKEK